MNSGVVSHVLSVFLFSRNSSLYFFEHSITSDGIQIRKEDVGDSFDVRADGMRL